MNMMDNMSLKTNTLMESKFLSKMGFAFGGTARIGTGGLDLVKMWEQTKDLLTSSQTCVVLLCPMGSNGRSSNGKKEIMINL